MKQMLYTLGLTVTLVTGCATCDSNIAPGQSAQQSEAKLVKKTVTAMRTALARQRKEEDDMLSSAETESTFQAVIAKLDPNYTGNPNFSLWACKLKYVGTTNRLDKVRADCLAVPGGDPGPCQRDYDRDMQAACRDYIDCLRRHGISITDQTRMCDPNQTHYP